jgi:hypothetical protein
MASELEDMKKTPAQAQYSAAPSTPGRQHEEDVSCPLVSIAKSSDAQVIDETETF